MSTPPYRNARLSPAERVDDLLARMTLEEKAGQLFHPYSFLPDDDTTPEEAIAKARAHVQDKHLSHFVVVNGTGADEIAEWVNTVQQLAAQTRLGIPVTFSTDPRSGYKSSPYTGAAIPVISRWPENIGIGAIGDAALAREYGDIVRQELIAMGIRSYLGPMADLFTEPRWMRGFGTYGEDAGTAAALATAFVRGLRGGDEVGPESVTAVLKHFPGAGPQSGGNDAIDVRFPDQVYPGAMQELHLAPFAAAIADGVTQLMVYYGMPVGTAWEERGFAFNGPVIGDLLRGRYGFDGIVTTDWNVVDSEPFFGEPFGPIAHGVEHLSVSERLALALDVGIDQFGGDTSTAEVCELVRSGRIGEDRLDASVRRILREKFRLGLFDAAPVDPEAAVRVASDPAFWERGTAAQRRSLVLLADAGALPLSPGTAVYSEGIAGAAARGLTEAASPTGAQVNVVRLDAPWEHDPDSRLGDSLHGGSLEFPDEVVQHIAELAAAAPTIVVVYLERPAVLTPLMPLAAALMADFGASDEVVWDALTGAAAIGGRLPFDLPRSMAAVEASREDVPFDTADPLFRLGDGIRRP
ncbi:MAG: glycoside hydrolase family 3 N-terminal domain-containing protein [Microbacterium sp.]